jgi:hypothetical protein
MSGRREGALRDWFALGLASFVLTIVVVAVST